MLRNLLFRIGNIRSSEMIKMVIVNNFKATLIRTFIKGHLYYFW